MTLCNVHVSSKRALVAVDTLQYSSDGKPLYRWSTGAPREGAKIHPVPHANFVLTGRGASALFSYLSAQFESATNLDETIKRMPDLLRRASSTLRTIIGPGRGTYPRDEVHLVGWSNERGHMVAATWHSDCGFATVDDPMIMGSEIEGRSGYRLAPSLPHTPGAHVALPNSVKTMREYARQQVEFYRADQTSVSYGGRIVVADMTEHGMTLTTAGELGVADCGPGHPFVWSEEQENSVFNIASAIATMAQVASAASGSVTVTTNSFVETDATTLTWTNDAGFAVPVQIEHTANITSVGQTGTANGFGYVKAYWSVSGGGGSSGVVFGPLTSVGAAEANYSTVDQVSVGDGLTITVRCAIGAQEFAGVGNVVTNYANVVSRVTAVVR